MRYSPRKMNSVGIAHLMKHRCANLFAKPGTGKTAMTLTALSALAELEGDVFPALVVAPLRVARTVWDTEIAKWDHVKHLRVSKVIGSRAQRIAALNKEADVYVINFENANWLMKYLGTTMPFKTIVVDESSKLRGSRCQIKTVKGTTFFARGGTLSASAITRMGMRVGRRINLTGTPSANGLESLWGQQFFLDHGSALGRTFGGFRNRWFRQVVKPDENSVGKWVPLPHSFDEITEAIEKLTLSIDPANYETIEKVRVVDVPVEMSPDVLKLYRDTLKEAVVKLDPKEITLFSVGAVTAKLSQIASGFVYDEDGTTHEVHDAKLEALDDLLEELEGHPVIVVYHYKAQLARLKARYPQARELPKGSAQKDVEAQWNRGEIPMLLIHAMSAGHGLNLQHGGCDMVILDPTWDLELYQQVIERIGPTRQMQAGYKRTVSVYRVFAEKTVDVQILSRLDEKASLQDAVMEAMR